MADTIARTLGTIKGLNPATDLLSTMSIGAVASEGMFLYADNSEVTNKLKAGTDKAEYLLMENVTANGLAFTDIMFQIDRDVKAVGDKVGVAMLRPGMLIETKMYQTSGTGPITSDTALESALSVISGKVCAKQGSGDGDVQFFVLKENNIATTGFITVLVTHVGA